MCTLFSQLFQVHCLMANYNIILEAWKSTSSLEFILKGYMNGKVIVNVIQYIHSKVRGHGRFWNIIPQGKVVFQDLKTFYTQI